MCLHYIRIPKNGKAPHTWLLKKKKLYKIYAQELCARRPKREDSLAVVEGVSVSYAERTAMYLLKMPYQMHIVNENMFAYLCVLCVCKFRVNHS